MAAQFAVHHLEFKVRSRSHWSKFKETNEVSIGISEFLSFMNLNSNSKQPANSTENHQTIFCDVSFELQRGEVLGIMDTSSSSKRTLCSVLGGKLSANHGNIEYAGKRAYFSQIFASASAYKNLAYNLVAYARLTGFSKVEAVKALDEIQKIKLFSSCLRISLKRLPKELISAVWFCYILELRVDIFILDDSFEPNNQELRLTCANKLQNAVSDGMTIIMGISTKNTQQSLLTKILLLDRGMPVIFASPQTVKYEHPALFELASKKEQNATDSLDFNEDDDDDEEQEFFQNQLENPHNLNSSEMGVDEQQLSIEFDNSIKLTYADGTEIISGQLRNDIPFEKTELLMLKPDTARELRVTFEFFSPSSVHDYQAFAVLRKKKKIDVAIFSASRLIKLEAAGRFLAEVIIPSNVLQTGIFQFFPMISYVKHTRSTGEEIKEHVFSSYYLDLLPLPSNLDNALNAYRKYKNNLPNMPILNIRALYRVHRLEHFNFLVDINRKQKILPFKQPSDENDHSNKMRFLLHSNYLKSKPIAYLLVQTDTGNTLSVKVEPKLDDFHIDGEFCAIEIELENMSLNYGGLRILKMDVDNYDVNLDQPMEIFDIHYDRDMAHSKHQEQFDLRFFNK